MLDDQAAKEAEAVGGREMKLSVCVALAGPVLVRLAVTGMVPSAMLKWLMERLKMAKEPSGWSEILSQLYICGSYWMCSTHSKEPRGPTHRPW